MRFRELEDPFYKNQPSMEFVEILNSPIHSETPHNWNKREKKKNEIFIKNINLVKNFNDYEGLLDSTYKDFKDFMNISDIEASEDGICLETVKEKTPCFEAYKINVSEEKIVVSANDTEGIRRAFIFIEDEMKRRSGAFLPLGEIERKPFIKTRISRCFFTPPSHSPDGDYVNELCDDVDYYGEEYLNRLMHDGINGLWLGASFRDILTSKIIPEYGQDSKRRIEKLNKVVEKCRRYGIGIYLFAVEPASSYSNPAFMAHTEFHGDNDGGLKMFCPSLKACEDYIKESVSQLFEKVPHLKGIIDITVGEALSGCGSDESEEAFCRRCKKKFGTIGRTLAATEKMLADAVKAASPDAEFISWTYAHRSRSFDEIIEAGRHRDPNVIHMENFEDCGDPVQLGKERLALDYWLSYVGPGKVMKTSLAENKKRGVRTYAKIQACSSHEISSVPYVPAPGILYDKYKYMHENGISGVLQCWYFGNYPCLMNKAACELAFEPYFDSKEDFLRHLAGIYWGEDCEKVKDAYLLFEKGYKNFPCSMSFEWFGPMQDSPAAPLRLLPVDLHMPETWLCKTMPGGDRLGDAFRDGHTMDEVCELLRRMSTYWSEGEEIISTLDANGKYERAEQLWVSSAVSILFASGYNIVRFYDLRRKLGILEGDASEILDKMQAIAYEEIENSKKLKALCEVDGRLGYHPEAHGYKFFPAKLDWRIKEVERALKEEFPYVRQRIADKKAPLGFYFAEHEEARAYQLTTDEIEKSKPIQFLTEDGKESSYTTLFANEKDGVITVKIVLDDFKNDVVTIRPEFRMFEISAPFMLEGGEIIIKKHGGYSFFGEKIEERKRNMPCVYEEDGEKCSYTFKFARKDFNMGELETFRFSIKRKGEHNEWLCLPDRMYHVLIDGAFSPDEYAFFLPAKRS